MGYAGSSVSLHLFIAEMTFTERSHIQDLDVN